MANTLYDGAREAFLQGQINWLTDTIKVALARKSGKNGDLVGGSVTLADFGAGVIVTPPGAVTLTNKTATAGAADGADITFTAVTGETIDAILIYKEGATPDTSLLIAHIDTATGLPITPNGGDIIVTWDNGTNKIFKL